jgi:hypothetical protein
MFFKSWLTATLEGTNDYKVSRCDTKNMLQHVWQYVADFISRDPLHPYDTLQCAVHRHRRLKLSKLLVWGSDLGTNGSSTDGEEAGIMRDCLRKLYNGLHERVAHPYSPAQLTVVLREMRNVVQTATTVGGTWSRGIMTKMR